MFWVQKKERLADVTVNERERQKMDSTVTDAAYVCGFFGTSYFGKESKKSLHCTPGQCREVNRKGENRDYAGQDGSLPGQALSPPSLPR